jgi:hypothetical protein
LRLAHHTPALPIYPELTLPMIERVVRGVAQISTKVEQ